MTFTQIRYFVEVAECLSFTEAAGKLYVSQQIVSKQISSLESEIGLRLFSRTTKHVSLTAGGHILYETWKEMLDRTEEALKQAAEINERLKRKIRIGVAEMAGVIDYVLVVLARYTEQFPEVEFEPVFMPYKKLQDMLKNRELDFIITLATELEKSISSYSILPLEKVQLAIIMSVKNPLSKREYIQIRDLKQETFYIFSKAYSIDAADRILHHCRQEGFTPINIKYFDNINSMEMALYTGKGVAVNYSRFFRNKDQQLKMYPIKEAEGLHEQFLVAACLKKDEPEMESLFKYFADSKDDITQ
jgi:DNA-binding transcriptional LysR family regulator